MPQPESCVELPSSNLPDGYSSMGCGSGCLTSAPQLPRVSLPCSVKTCMSLPLDCDLLGTGQCTSELSIVPGTQCVRAQSLSHPTLCNPMDFSLPGSSVHGIFQARILELACHFLLQGIFPTHSMCSDAQSCPTLCDPMDYSPCQAPLSMGFFWQKYWSELAFLPPGDLLVPEIKPVSLMSSALAGGFFTTSAT